MIKLDEPTDVLVGVVMGSKSDWPTMKLAAEVLQELDIRKMGHLTALAKDAQTAAQLALEARKAKHVRPAKLSADMQAVA